MLNNFSLIITLSLLSRQLFEDQPDGEGREAELGADTRPLNFLINASLE